MTTENEEIEFNNQDKNEEKVIEYKKPDNFESVVDYTTKLSVFEGPLDLLLYLVNRAEIPIRDIFVSEVTEQFLEYVRHAEDLDMEKEGEYLAMAATLLEIKARSILPAYEFEDNGEYFDEEDPKENLFRQLEDELKMFQEAGAKLKEIETTDIFFKKPDESANEVRIEYTDFNLDNLIKAFSNLMAKIDLENRIKNEQKEIPKEVYTVADKINYIKETMVKRESCSFYDLFAEDASKPEIITTFQALLELLKLQYLTVEQKDTFSDITITLREDRSEEVGDLSEYN